MNKESDLGWYLDKWQRILRLQDWTVKLRWARYYDIKSMNGQVSWSLTKRFATIEILDPYDYNNPDWPYNPEKTLVHELLHLQFAVLDDTNGLRERLLEQGIESLAEALITLDAQRSRL